MAQGITTVSSVTRSEICENLCGVRSDPSCTCKETRKLKSGNVTQIRASTILNLFYLPSPPTLHFPSIKLTMATTQETRAPGKAKERPSALRSIIAGSTAGAVEIGISSHANPRHPYIVVLILANSHHLSRRMYVYYRSNPVFFMIPNAAIASGTGRQLLGSVMLNAD